MAGIKFSQEEQVLLVRKLQLYFREELDAELAQFDGQFLLDFISEEMGAYFYNRGLYDAQALFQSKIDAVGEAVYELEIPTEFMR
ncbi:MAG: DUF2164 domain-containing protein [Pseudomonadales bacterium]|nr:DUF2164 domain-containing protein [Pseudomonadales bacterium]